MNGAPLHFDPEFLLRERAWVEALARSLTRDASSADDVVQDTWLAALLRPPESRRPGQVRAFLGTIARRIASAREASDRRRRERERRTALPESTVRETDALDRLAVQRILATALLELREPYRTPVAMRYVDALRPGEIAVRLARPPETVRTQIARGLELLRERLDREYGGDRAAWSALLVGLFPVHASAVLAGTFGGGILGSKSVIAVAATLVVVAGWWSWSHDARSRLRETQPLPTPVAETANARSEGPPKESDATRTPAPAIEEIAANAAASFRGQVVSAVDRRPLAGATIEVAVESSRAKEQRGRELRRAEESLRSGAPASAGTRTVDEAPGPRRGAMQTLLQGVCDGKGRFELAAAPPEDAWLVARARGHVPHAVEWRRIAASPKATLELAPTAVLEVELVDPSGAPVGGTWITIRAADRGEAGSPWIEPPTSDRGFGPSDGAGRLTIEALPAGIELTLTAKVGDAGKPAGKPVAVTLDPVELRGSVRMVLPLVGALKGIVAPPPAEKERVDVRFVSADPEGRPASVSVDPAGAFHFERLPSGTGTLTLDTVRLGSRATITESGRLRVEIVAEETTDVGRLDLERPVRLAGRVVGWDGASSNDFLDLRCLRAGRPLARTTFDGEGRFELWSSAGPCMLELVHAGRVIAAFPARAPDEDVELDPFLATAGLRGRLIHGKEDARFFFPMLIEGDPAGDGWTVPLKPTVGVVTVVEGAFRMLFLEPGRHSLFAVFGDAGATWIPRLDLECGRELDLGTLVAGFAAIEGRVVDREGTPIVATEVVLESPFSTVVRTHGPTRALTDADGRFHVDRVAAGPWRARATQAGSVGESALLDALPGTTQRAEIVLAPTARLSVRVLHAGKAVDEGTVALERADGPMRRIERRLDRDGRCEFVELAAGGWRWSVEAGRSGTFGTIAIRSGEARELAIDVDRDPIRFRLLGEEARLRVTEAAAWRIDESSVVETARAARCGTGTFELGLAPGRYLLVLRGTLDDDGSGTVQRTAVLDVARDAVEEEVVCASASLEIRASEARCNGSAPEVTLVALDGKALGRRGVAIPMDATGSGWRGLSVPPGARIRVRGTTSAGTVVEGVLVGSASARLELDWE